LLLRVAVVVDVIILAVLVVAVFVLEQLYL
jgi:hypothetical protein